MNKRDKPLKKKKGAALGVVICFVAAIVIVGTYTMKDYQEEKRREFAKAEENVKAKEKKEREARETGNRLVINTEDTKEDVREEENPYEETKEEEAQTEAAESQTKGTGRNINFGRESRLLWPVDGNVILNYSMDKTIYFSTLDQYKYNPAVIISGAEGDQVICGAPGIVKSIDVTAQTGTTVNVDIGNGYELFYGQLKETPVKTGDYVEAKSVLGYVSQPTKYYSLEGCNVYFAMKRDGKPVNPMDYMAE